MPAISAGDQSREERQALYRSARSERNDDWTPAEIALNRAGHQLLEAKRALERAESELRLQVDEAVNVEGMPLERVVQLTPLDEQQVLAQLAALERRNRDLDALPGQVALELRGARSGE